MWQSIMIGLLLFFRKYGVSQNQNYRSPLTSILSQREDSISLFWGFFSSCRATLTARGQRVISRAYVDEPNIGVNYRRYRYLEVSGAGEAGIGSERDVETTKHVPCTIEDVVIHHRRAGPPVRGERLLSQRSPGVPVRGHEVSGVRCCRFVVRRSVTASRPRCCRRQRTGLLWGGLLLARSTRIQ